MKRAVHSSAGNARSEIAPFHSTLSRFAELGILPSEAFYDASRGGRNVDGTGQQRFRAAVVSVGGTMRVVSLPSECSNRLAGHAS